MIQDMKGFFRPGICSEACRKEGVSRPYQRQLKSKKDGVPDGHILFQQSSCAWGKRFRYIYEPADADGVPLMSLRYVESITSIEGDFAL